MRQTAKSIKQLIRFGLVGCCNTTVDYGVFYILLAAMHLHKGVSQVIATGVAMCVSFLLNRKWTFQKEGKGNAKEVVKFVLTNLASMSVTILCTYLFYDLLHAERALNVLFSQIGMAYVLEGNSAVLFAKLLSTIFSLTVNFIGNKFWVFGNQKEEKTA